MGKKKGMDPIQDTQTSEVKPERNKGVSTKPKEAKKPAGKTGNPQKVASSTPKTNPSTPASTTSKVVEVKVVAKKETVQVAEAPATVTPKPESAKSKVKALKKQWVAADEKVDELKKAFKKLKKKAGKAKAKASLKASIKAAKVECKTSKKAFKVAKKASKKAA